MSEIEQKFREIYHEALGLPVGFDIDADQNLVDMYIHFANGYKVRQKEIDELKGALEFYADKGLLEVLGDKYINKYSLEHEWTERARQVLMKYRG
jgi:hypothetical protein